MKLLTLAALAAVAATTPAYAASSVAVRHGDLNLLDRQDAAIMVRRLESAAAEACGAGSESLREHRAAIRYTDCYARAMDAALVSVNSPTVTAAYRERAPQIAAR